MTKFLFILAALSGSFTFASTCNNEVIEKTMSHFCSELSKLKLEQISSLDALPEKNLQFDSCGQNAIVVYSSQEPFKIIRYPQRSWNNNVVDFGRGVGLFLRLTKEALDSKKMVNASVPYGAVSLEIQKTHYILACEGVDKNYPYLVATAYLQNNKKELVTPLLFQPPEYSSNKKAYDVLLDLKAPFTERSKAFDQIYDKAVDSAIEKLTTNFNLKKEVAEAFFKNDDTKKRSLEYLNFRFVNEKISADDAIGSIQTILDTLFTEAPVLDLANKSIIELEQVKKEKSELGEKLKSAEEVTQVLGKANNYTYSVAAAIPFLLTSIGLLIALLRKK